jgi:hypothetical protein
MNAPLEIIKDPSDGELMALFDFGDGEVGIVYPDRGTRREDQMKCWFDHAHSGSGCNNLILDAFGRELDLEFCRSREMTPAEAESVRSALALN